MTLPLSAFCIMMFLRSSNSENALCSAILMFLNLYSFLLYVLKEENAICRSSLRAKTISSFFYQVCENPYTKVQKLMMSVCLQIYIYIYSSPQPGNWKPGDNFKNTRT